MGDGVRGLVASSMESCCGALLMELQSIWMEIGESEEEKKNMMLDIDRECLEVYRRKVDEASNAKAILHRSVVNKEAELASLIVSLGEHNSYLQTEKRRRSLKEQLATITPLLDNMRLKRDERLKQLADIHVQITKIRAEITGFSHQPDAIAPSSEGEQDLSARKLTEYQSQLRTLQKEKSDRLQMVLKSVTEVHSLCGVLGMDFGNTVDGVHPSLHETGSEKNTSISDKTMEGLSLAISKLKSEKKLRVQKLRETMESLLELWHLMDSPIEERRHFESVIGFLKTPEEGIQCSGVLKPETIKQAEDEVVRLTKLKASRMKELVSKKRSELEEICRRAHIEPDPSSAPDKTNALIDSGLVDSSDLLAKIEIQISKAREESIRRSDIMDKINKWLAACEEEHWLEEYNQDESRYTARRGVHLNLKRAEKARMTIAKIPATVDNLMAMAFAWEDERNMPFLYDGVRLVSILDEYKLSRQQKEEEKRRSREHKKVQYLLLAEKEARYGSKPSPRRCNSFNRNTNGLMTPNPGRRSLGSATPELLTPRSHSFRRNGYFGETRRLSATAAASPLNFVALSKEDNMSSLTSISGSEPESPFG